MSKVKYAILRNIGNEEVRAEIRRWVRVGLVSSAACKGFIIIGRYGTNKTTLRYILRKEIGA